jgi:hypothetical protein
MPPREWAMAKSQFAVLFGERFTTAIAGSVEPALPRTKFLTHPIVAGNAMPQPQKPPDRVPRRGVRAALVSLSPAGFAGMVKRPRRAA